MANKPKRKKVTQLPLIADCRISKEQQSCPLAHHVFPTLTAQLESSGDEIYEVPLSVRAPRGQGGWQIAGYTNTLDDRSAFILFRHPDETYLVQCRARYDVTRKPPFTSNCYKLQ